MSERYARLFALPENLYQPGSPVMILAGALLKDNQTGGILALMKFKNVGTKPIRGLKVRFSLRTSPASIWTSPWNTSIWT